MICFRYPGGKTKIKDEIVGRIKRYYEQNDCYDVCQYVEPFFGAGSVGLHFMSSSPIKNALISDFDPAISAFWGAVIFAPDALCQMVEEFKPSTEAFFSFKKLLTSEEMHAFRYSSSREPMIRIGFAKLALHQISYSGLGPMSGGPLGGVSQESKYKVDCRWNPDNIKKKIRKAHQILSSVDLYQGGCCEFDFSYAIDLQKDKREWEDSGVPVTYEVEEPVFRFFYLDPPYYEKGGELYQYSFNEKHHEDLMRMLKRTEHPWLLSYDACPEIKQLYKWASIKEIDLTYTINAKKKGRVKTEFLIAPPEFSELLEDLREKDIFE
jgi:DNA adenine methylase